jgi:hypothetical protein
MKKLSFEIIRFQADILYSLSTTAGDYSALLKDYLHSCGWSEKEFAFELNRRALNKLS